MQKRNVIIALILLLLTAALPANATRRIVVAEMITNAA
jgi:hypothetical protein